MGVSAFLPLVIFIFMNKDANKKAKGIAGSIAVVALLVAGISGIGFASPICKKIYRGNQCTSRSGKKFKP